MCDLCFLLRTDDAAHGGRGAGVPEKGAGGVPGGGGGGGEGEGGGGRGHNVLCFTSFLLLSVTIVVQQCVRRYFASQSSCSHFHACMVLHDVCMGMVVLDDAHCHGCMVLHDVCQCRAHVDVYPAVSIPPHECGCIQRTGKAVLSCQQLKFRKRRAPKRAFRRGFSVIVSCLRTLLHTFGPSYAALFNEEYAFSLGFAAILLSLEAPNAGHVPGVATYLCPFLRSLPRLLECCCVC